MPTIIKRQDELERLAEELNQASLVGVDTESNSLHAYQERVCLIQISTREQDYIVDPLALRDLSPLGEVFANPAVEKVFHAAEYDLTCMKRDFGFEMVNLFDTMAAARICGFSQFGLGALLQEYAGIHLDKSHQRDDWGKRPLPIDSLRYAQMDTHFLPMLRDEFHGELLAQGHMDEAREIFAEICETPAATPRSYDPRDFWKIGLPNMLNEQEMKVLNALYVLRETIAQDRDVPPFKVFSNRQIVEMARVAPQSMNQLRGIRQVSQRQAQRYGKRVLEAVREGLATKDLPDPPRRPQPDAVIVDRYAALQTWRKERAQARGVESDVIISKHALWEIAETAPQGLDEMRQIRGVGPWRLQAYGDEILGVLGHIMRTED